jgi:uncharacterized protein (DUF58 family)
VKLNFEEIKQSGSLELLAKQLVEGFITGLHKSPYHGFSVEFAEHRLYNEGQSTRHIDWKVFARTDRLYTKQYEEETNLRCLLLIDCSPSMYYPKDTFGKLRFSIYSTSAIAYLLHRQDRRIHTNEINCFASRQALQFNGEKDRARRASTQIDKSCQCVE